MINQLSIPVPIEATESNLYAPAISEYTKDIQAGRKDVYLCYCNSTKKYFVSHYFKKESIELFKIKIIK